VQAIGAHEVPGGLVQLPPMQVEAGNCVSLVQCAPGHFVPHIPQLLLSLSVPLLHLHTPPVQCSPNMHALPQDPQLLSSLRVPLAHPHFPCALQVVSPVEV
jgi:hypothetical protein